MRRNRTCALLGAALLAGVAACGGDGGSGPEGPVPTAFRLTSLALREPHVFYNLLFTCQDVTAVLNTELQNAISSDGDGDGFLDFAYLLAFRPLEQDAPGGQLEIGAARCTAGSSAPTCDFDAAAGSTNTAYTNDQASVCLDAIPGTTSSHTPALVAAGPPCFVIGPQDIGLTLFGTTLPLTDAQFGGTYSGDPANDVAGLLRAFVTEAAAAAIVPVTGNSLAEHLPGGTGSCASFDGRDQLGNGTRGWWLYFNYTAERAPYTGG